MKCHYEVLELSQSACDEEVKRSYRRLALKWHPDKNPDNVEECTKLFNLIQQAYDILIDPQERAWYDRHRDAILKGGLDEHFKDNSLNLFPYFSGSCYSGYGDDDKGFYAIYNHVFETIIQEDADFMENRSQADKVPRFGNATSTYDDIVGPFYGYWQSYSTSKSYVWLDEHDILQAPNRRVLRLMEKENKKIRDSAKKQRNEEVRTLVEFVRKRDKRILAHRRMLEEQRQKQLAKVEEQRLTQKLKNLNAAERYEDADWHDVSAREDDLKEIESHFDKCYDTQDALEDESTITVAEATEMTDIVDDYDDPLYCVACEKSFKTMKSYQNHERSKRHLDNFNLLKSHFTADELALLKLNPVEKITEGSLNDRHNKLPTGAKRASRKALRRDFSSSNPDSSSSDDNYDEVIRDEGIDKPVKGELSCEKEPSACAATETVVNNQERLPENDGARQNDKPKREHRKIDRTNVAPSIGEQKESYCSTCGQILNSRNKLFEHLKQTGHAALKYQQPAAARDKKKNKNKNKS